VPFVEAASRLRTPFIVPVLLFLAVMLALALSLGEDAAVRLLGGPGRPGDPASLLPLAARAGATLTAGFAAFLLRAGRLPGLRRDRPGRPWVCPDGSGTVASQRWSSPTRHGGDP
ncbi:MAG: hypothetical protein GWM90_29245, partial [Gemmatimonadetes bacterium]|nr:hypothetical protein [Gemmatimonadota bacterium]NIQ59133.1 hypothetical protein [Gemmatimonadota bacterium]NIU79337.1 hypothetical protein [Gammaproteobacteria bacterium]NIX48007.1 hypothetical protein [Gemmatimonadota bacterium]NIY12379.1 hypothetical protein [Gemmatimonadota bacterium]